MKIFSYWRYLMAAVAGALLFFGLQTVWRPAGPASAAAAHEQDAEHAHDGAAEDDAAEAGHGAHALRLTSAQLAANGIGLQTARVTDWQTVLRLPGQLQLDADREARLLSPVAGRVSTVRAQVGEKLAAGAVLATIDSAELAAANADWLAARERRALAAAAFGREESLWQKKISAEQDYLQARKELAEARIAENRALQALLALGVSEQDARALKDSSALSRYTLRAPLAGTVLERPVVRGETVSPEKLLFRMADLSVLWMELAVPVADLAGIRRGQRVYVSESRSGVQGEGRVLFVQPELAVASRTGVVRVALDNAQGQWRPGMFVNAELRRTAQEQVLSVPESALQTLDGKRVVFVADADGLEARELRLGRRAGGRVEVLAGLEAGERYAATGSFVLKAEQEKSEAEHEH